MSKTYTYTSATESLRAMSLTRGLKMHDVFRAVVIRDGNRVVWTGNTKSDKRSAAMEAGKVRKRFEHYQDSHGRCWRADEDGKTIRKAITAAKESARRIVEKEYGPRLAAAAREILTGKRAADGIHALSIIMADLQTDAHNRETIMVSKAREKDVARIKDQVRRAREIKKAAKAKA